MKRGSEWTEDELHLLRSRYPTHGPDRLAAMLPGRTALAVKTKAMALGLNVGDVKGWVPVGYIAKATGLHRNTVSDRAKRQGVAREIKAASGRTYMLLVPEAWADAYVRAVERASEADDLRGHHYTLRQAAKVIGVHPYTIRRWLYAENPDSFGARLMARIRFISTTGRQRRAYLFNPYDVEEAAREYKKWRQHGQ